MRFEVSERIKTSKSEAELLTALDAQFNKISGSTNRAGQTIIAKAIEASFGSINRSDTTTISLRKMDDGWLVLADVHYRPSFAFWVILIVTLFTTIGWIIPIAFYLLQKKTVREAIVECFQRIKNEHEQLLTYSQQNSLSSFEDIERWASLKEKGIITVSEFDEKKKQLLGI